MGSMIIQLSDTKRIYIQYDLSKVWIRIDKLVSFNMISGEIKSYWDDGYSLELDIDKIDLFINTIKRVKKLMVLA